MTLRKPIIKIDHVSKIFDPSNPPALNQITAEIPKGEIIGLAGPDGAGKTTLIRLIAGLLLPTEGDITVAGYDTKTEQTEIANLISYMPQKFGLYEDLSVQQNLNLYADLKNLPEQDRQTTFDRLLSFTQLGPFSTRLAGNLSGGMKQKLGLACSLISKPTLLLLDEPSVGVDPISRRELWKMVQELLGEGISIIWSTAYLDEAERCDRVLLLNEGKLLFYGPVSNLTRRVEGRTFKLTNIKQNRRQLLEQVLKNKEVIDGVIQGSEIRLVLKEEGVDRFNKEETVMDKGIEIIPILPRFEDAFIDILGGGPGGRSLLAEKTLPIHEREGLAVDARNLTKKFGSFVAAGNISFQIKPGEIFGLLGPNGAGKTTTFKMLCGLLQPTAGEAYVEGVNLQTAPSEARSHIGYMAQKFSLYGDLSVWQNLNFFAGIYNLCGAAKKNAIEQVIEIFNFQQYLDQSAGGLPLGYKQRLALACAVMHRPEVLFLDEPTSGVDPITRREFWNHINGLVEKGVTVMVTTHFMDEAEYCDRIALVYRSKIITIGSPDELKAQAKTQNNPHPTLEDAFIHLIEMYDKEDSKIHLIEMYDNGK